MKRSYIMALTPEQILERLNTRDPDDSLHDDYFVDAEDEQARMRRGTRTPTSAAMKGDAK
jgi:hypothetical protein